MADVREQYTDELYKNFGYYATWEPGTIREIGEVGVLKDNEFIHETSLKNLKVEFKIIEDEVKHDLNYSSKGSVSITQKLHGKTSDKASAIGEAEAGFVVEFGKEKAVLLKASGVSTIQIDDQAALKNDILRLYKEGIWEKNWVVITELKKAESATVIISNSTNSKIEIAAKAAMPNSPISLANGEIGLNVVYSSGINTEIIAKKDLTPLFRLKGLKTSFFGAAKVENRGIEGDESTETTTTDAASEDDSIDFDEVKYQKDKDKEKK